MAHVIRNCTDTVRKIKPRLLLMQFAMRYRKCYTSFWLFCLIQTATAIVFTSKDGVEINYKFNLNKRCHSENGRFALIFGLSMNQCIEKCGLRDHCRALNFRRFTVCEFFLTSEEGVQDDVGCIHINASDITVTQKPCGKCAAGQACDVKSKTCTYTECLTTPVLENGKILGNNYKIGGTIRYSCNARYQEKNGITTSVCLDNGQWSKTAECVTACGDPPSIEHGTVVSDGGNFYLDTATVTCEPWFRASTPKIICTATGTWEKATCIDCYISEPWEYAGKRNVSHSGTQCQRWDSQTPRQHTYTDVSKYPDTTLSEAENYCRNPSRHSGGIWCYTMDTSKNRWELCNISKC